MNDAGKERAQQLAQREYSAMEYRNRLVRMQNMDCICHCSAEIDMGTLLYYSVNDMYLGQGSFVLLLFSEIGGNTPDQREGRDVFGRMFTYAMIEEIAREAFTGHYSFYSSELDGRLVLIINFPFGMLPDRSIVDYMDVTCREVTGKCAERYGLQVVTYLSEPISDVRSITAVYTKLLETATLHRYTGRVFSAPVFHVPLPSPTQGSVQLPTLQERANDLVAALLGGGDYRGEAGRVLEAFAQRSASSIDNLKRLFGDYFELICRRLAQLGVSIQADALRQEQFQILFNSVQWAEPVNWFQGMLDDIRQEYAQTAQKAARRQFDRALRYMQENLCQPAMTIEKCAAAAGCSESALGKAFRRQLGCSAARYVRARRLEQALELLRSGCSVREACDRSGFGSVETFHRDFKAAYGVTPGQMRSADKG